MSQRERPPQAVVSWRPPRVALVVLAVVAAGAALMSTLVIASMNAGREARTSPEPSARQQPPGAPARIETPERP
ncbi:hypothetical protein DPM19_23480 [Actinomadura craniellae]|uniref:Uncharacterized protein n=2 Tax=Actinomadura craniellae TaxID=2231787 RepID=A0A365H0G2_9ACTN|nr:hypothetical protein DPM19_23480 [Actinomadura craniellae]